MRIYPETLIDGYKLDHRRQLCPGTTLTFLNLTPRRSYRRHKVEKVVWFGAQYFVKRFLLKLWNEDFFQQPLEKVAARYTRRVNTYLGPNSIGIEHIAQLHALGHLPLKVMALKEGARIPYRVAPMVVFSTDDRFGWLAAYIETIWSVTVWPLSTSATTAKQFRDLLAHYAKLTTGDTGFVKYAGHNFSYRGCFGHEAAMLVDAGHALSFVGSDTVPGIDWLEEYYGADSERELVTCSVAATEHGTMSSYGEDGEFDAYLHLVTEVYPDKEIVSIVSDTRDYWRVMTEYTVRLKDAILRRSGKIVFRPDSGDNVKVICGDPDAPEGSPEYKGTIQCLWDVFGGTTNDLGFKVLDPHVGAILGDGVNLEVAMAICEGLVAKGFATTNLVYGMGSFLYQYGISRDTDGWAVKSTYCVVNGEGREIFKAPKTDKDGFKHSARGLIAVFRDDNGEYWQKDRATWDEVLHCEYEPVFENSRLLRDQTLREIRAILNPDF